MDIRSLLKFAPAFIRPALEALLQRLEALEKAVAELQQQRKS